MLLKTYSQFFFQTVFILPSFIKSVMLEVGSDWEELVNARTISILLSFISFSRSFYSIRYNNQIYNLLMTFALHVL